MSRKGQGVVTTAELDTLALRVREREPGGMLELWEAVRRFVVMLAHRRAAVPGCRTTVEDLTQAGFLAVITTADQYKPGAGHSFIQALSFSLKKAFAEESGTRSTKRDALQYAKEKHFIPYSELSDIVLNNTNLGWEITGTFDAALTIYSLSVEVEE